MLIKKEKEIKKKKDSPQKELLKEKIESTNKKYNEALKKLSNTHESLDS